MRPTINETANTTSRRGPLDRQNAALGSAAMFVARCGFPTTVLVPRRPWVVGEARALADSCGLEVAVDLRAMSAAIRFSRATRPT
jgi:hypothetical protein